MEGFNHILNWKLLVGSHEFPGKDGGTCINEAAVIAAGLNTGASTKSKTCRAASPGRSASSLCS
jgi:hypothetical protein